MDEMSLEEKYKRVLKIIKVRDQIIVAQAMKIHELEGQLVAELENPPPKERQWATQNDMEDAIVRSGQGHEPLRYDPIKERFVERARVD